MKGILARESFWIGCIIVAANFPLLLTDAGLYNTQRDLGAIEDNDFPRLLFHYQQIGRPMFAYFHWAIGALPEQLRWHKIIALTFMVVAGISMYWVARRSRVWSATEALFLAVFALAYPVYNMWQEPVMAPYAVAYGLFFLGAHWYGKYIDRPVATSGYLWLALAAFSVSFLVPSFLVFFYGLMAFVLVIDGGVKAPVVPQMWQWVRRHAFALALPLVNFGLQRALLPRPSGRYVLYNKIEVSIAKITYGMVVAAKRSLVDEAIDFLRLPWNDPSLFLLATPLALLVGALVYWATRSLSTRRLSFREFLGVLALTGVVYFTAVFAYAVVSKNVQPANYASRHGLLLSIPIGLGLIALLRFIISNNRLFRASVAAIIAACVVLQTRNYVMGQNRYVKYLGIIERLKERPDTFGGFVSVKDRANFGLMGVEFGSEEINWILKSAFGTMRHWGFDGDMSFNEALVRKWLPTVDANIYMARDTQLDGSVTEIVVRSATEFSNAQIFVRDLITFGPERKRFARSLVELSYRDFTVDWHQPLPPHGAKKPAP